MNKTCFCGIAEHCGYQIEMDMEQHDKVVYEDGYHKGYTDGSREREIQIRDEIQDYINDLICARDIVVTGAHPETNGSFGTAVADGQKIVLDNVISKLEGMIKEMR